jgi:redox-sensing transcriptional repressor
VKKVGPPLAAEFTLPPDTLCAYTVVEPEGCRFRSVAKAPAFRGRSTTDGHSESADRKPVGATVTPQLQRGGINRLMNDESDKTRNSGSEGAVPKAVVARLSLYLRELQNSVRSGNETTSSSQLGEKLGLTDAQVRKDLAYFGQFGYPGVGYRCEELIQAIRQILGTNRHWPVAIIGTGNLGSALLGYKGFTQQGFEVVAAFDVDRTKIGRRIQGVPIFDLQSLVEVTRTHGIQLAILAVPAESAQGVADLVVASGINGILNFAPVRLTLPREVHCVGVDLAIELEQLSFAVVNRTP